MEVFGRDQVPADSGRLCWKWKNNKAWGASRLALNDAVARSYIATFNPNHMPMSEIQPNEIADHHLLASALMILGWDHVEFTRRFNLAHVNTSDQIEKSHTLQWAFGEIPLPEKAKEFLRMEVLTLFAAFFGGR